LLFESQTLYPGTYKF